MEIYNVLDKLNIKYEELTHKAVYTIEEALEENIPDRIEGIECKNLFVKSKTSYYLIFIRADKRSVTPLGIINDKDNIVTLLIDKELENKKVLVHPNINTKTLSIKFDDLMKFIEYTEHRYMFF